MADHAGASFGFELDAELTANLKALSQRHGTTLFMTLLAAWAALLARMSGQSDVEWLDLGAVAVGHWRADDGVQMLRSASHKMVDAEFKATAAADKPRVRWHLLGSSLLGGQLI